MDRRDFLKTGAAVATMLQTKNVMGANDRVRVAIVGLRGRGKDHIKRASEIPGVEIAALCDIDDSVIAQRLQDLDKQGLPKPKTYTDYRKLLEDKSIDAVSIATPNHWHSLMGIWAVQAGKDAYIEKPCSHNFWEGKQLVAAVAKYDRIVQHGSQSRSSIGIREAMGHINSGRDTIGHQAKAPIPSGVNYDLWLGPAPDRGFTKNRFHYTWHWFWDTGNGDLGNQGIHEVDIARWGLGVKYPTKVSAIGGHFMFDDDQETPNTLNCAYEFNEGGKKRMMEIEVRHWMTNHEAEIGLMAKSSIPAAGLAVDAKPAPGAPKDPAMGPVNGKPGTIGNIFYGPKGYLAIQEYETYKTWLGDQNTPGPEGHGKENHYVNFIECVRNRKKENLNSPVEEGHMSATLVHLANVSYRLGRTLNFDPAKQEVTGDHEANLLLRDGDRGYRKGFVVPEKV
jgi:predicted dehydrogenase